jgi:hypothetical protein
LEKVVPTVRMEPLFEGDQMLRLTPYDVLWPPRDLDLDWSKAATRAVGALTPQDPERQRRLASARHGVVKSNAGEGHWFIPVTPPI